MPVKLGVKRAFKMVHPDQAGRLWPPCGPLHYASALNSTQPKFVELVQQAQTQRNWLRCWAIDNGLAAVPCPAAAAAESSRRSAAAKTRMVVDRLVGVVESSHMLGLQ